MKKMKKLVSLLLATVMIFAMTITAFADETPHSITITNTNSNISIDGRTYSAYKLFDSTHSGDAYAYTMSTSNQFYSADLLSTDPATPNTLPAVLKKYFTFTAVVGDTSKVNVAPIGTFDARAFADEIQSFLTGKTATATATATGDTATINLPAGAAGVGYYIVTGDAVSSSNSSETVVSAVILTNEDPTAAIKPKADIPTLDKKITSVKEGTTPVVGAVLDDAGKAAVAKVGSTVSYKLDSFVPDLTGYTDYTFTFGDTITDGLDYVTDSFNLTINGTKVEIAPTFASGNRSFTLTIPYATLKQYTAGNAIVLTYDATVNSDSLKYDYVNNTAKLTYSNSPYTDETNDTPEKETYVININLDVNKVAKEENGAKLAGAEFILYRVVKDENNNDVNQYYKWDEIKKVVTWETKDAADKFTTGENGALTQQVRGLDKGTYYLVETKAPAGYNLLKDPIAITISVSEADEKVTYTSTSAAITNGTIDLTAAQNENQPVATETIINNTGIVLPSTGGMGTTIFYVLGTIFVLGAGVLLITRKRMSK